MFGIRKTIFRISIYLFFFFFNTATFQKFLQLNRIVLVLQWLHRISERKKEKNDVFHLLWSNIRKSQQNEKEMEWNPMSRHFIPASHSDWTGCVTRFFEQTRHCFLLSSHTFHIALTCHISALTLHSCIYFFRVKWNRNENVQALQCVWRQSQNSAFQIKCSRRFYMLQLFLLLLLFDLCFFLFSLLVDDVVFFTWLRNSHTDYIWCGVRSSNQILFTNEKY